MQSLRDLQSVPYESFNALAVAFLVVAFLVVIPAGNLLLHLPLHLLLSLLVFRRHPEPTAKDPRIVATTDAKSAPNNACDALCVRATTNAGLLRLRLRMTAKSKPLTAP
jgi:hypothetical protein